MGDDDLVMRSERGAVATLTLNRPATRNALSLDLLGALDRRLSEVDSDPRIRVVVLAGNGPAFSAGHDLSELSTASPDLAREIFTTCSAVMLRISNFSRPVIAKVGGVATAAGCQMVASCDLAVAATSARFATPGVNIGLFCSTPAVPLARTIAPKHAMEMLLTGELYGADDAFRMGLVNRVVPDEDLDSEVDSLAAVVASKPPGVVAAGRSALRRQMSLPLDEAYGLASDVMCEGLAGQDAGEGIAAFLEKRTPNWSASQ